MYSTRVEVDGSTCEPFIHYKYMADADSASARAAVVVARDVLRGHLGEANAATALELLAEHWQRRAAFRSDSQLTTTIANARGHLLRGRGSSASAVPSWRPQLDAPSDHETAMHLRLMRALDILQKAPHSEAWPKELAGLLTDRRELRRWPPRYGAGDKVALSRCAKAARYLSSEALHTVLPKGVEWLAGRATAVGPAERREAARAKALAREEELAAWRAYMSEQRARADRSFELSAQIDREERQAAAHRRSVAAAARRAEAATAVQRAYRGKVGRARLHARSRPVDVAPLTPRAAAAAASWTAEATEAAASSESASCGACDFGGGHAPARPRAGASQHYGTPMRAAGDVGHGLPHPLAPTEWQPRAEWQPPTDGNLRSALHDYASDSSGVYDERGWPHATAGAWGDGWPSACPSVWCAGEQQVERHAPVHWEVERHLEQERPTATWKSHLSEWPWCRAAPPHESMGLLVPPHELNPSPPPPGATLGGWYALPPTWRSGHSF